MQHGRSIAVSWPLVLCLVAAPVFTTVRLCMCINGSRMSLPVLLRSLPQAGCNVLTSPIISTGAGIWFGFLVCGIWLWDLAPSSSSVGFGSCGERYKYRVHLGVSTFESYSNATEWCGESYSAMRDAVVYEDGCSASSVSVINVMTVPGVPWDSVPLVQISEMGFLDCSHYRSSSDNFSLKLRSFCD